MPKGFIEISLDKFKEKTEAYLAPILESKDWDELPVPVDKCDREVSLPFWYAVGERLDTNRWNKILNEMMGYHRLSNGLCFLGMFTWDDEADPCFVILYLTPSGYAMYVPTDGNMWNTETCRSYGPDGGVANLVERFPCLGFERFLEEDYIDDVCLYEYINPISMIVDIAKNIRPANEEELQLKTYLVKAEIIKEFDTVKVDAKDTSDAAIKAKNKISSAYNISKFYRFYVPEKDGLTEYEDVYDGDCEWYERLNK